MSERMNPLLAERPHSAARPAGSCDPAGFSVRLVGFGAGLDRRKRMVAPVSRSFDYCAVASRLGLSQDQLAALEAGIRREVGSNNLKFELEMARILKRLAERELKAGQAGREFRSR